MPQPGLAPHAAHNAVASSLASKGQSDTGRGRGVPLTLSERVLVIVVMVGAWIAMSVLALVQR